MEKRSYEVTCPHCRAPLTYESRNLIGSKETCPHCQTVFHITEPVNESSVTVFSEDTDTEEYLKTTNLSDEEFHLLGIPAIPLIIVLICITFLLTATILFLLNTGRYSHPTAEENNAGLSVFETSESVPFTESSQIQDNHAVQDDTVSFEQQEIPDSELSEDDPDFLTDITEKIEENHFTDFAFPNETADLLVGSNDSSSDVPESVDSADSIEDENPDSASKEVQPESEIDHEESGKSVAEDIQNDTSETVAGENPKEYEEFDVSTNMSRDLTVLFSAMSLSLSEPINVAKRLGLKVRQIRLPQAGLADFIRLFYQLTGVPVKLGWRDFSTPVQIWEKRISYEAANLTVQQFLNEFSAAFNLDVAEQEDCVVLMPSPQEGDGLTRVTFECSDLLEADSETSRSDETSAVHAESIFSEQLSLSLLEGALRDLVLDETLVSADQHPILEVSADRKSLIVSADKKTIERASVFLDQLRSLRHLPTKGISDAEILIPENLCWDNKLSLRVSLTLLRPVPLSEILLLLERAYQIHFFYDFAAIPGSGAVMETPVKLIAKDRPMEQILSELLSPLGLEYVILTEDLIAVTAGVTETYDAEIHFYAAPEDDVPLNEAIALADRIRKTVSPESWQTDSRSGGKIWIDPHSHSFHIRQTISNQFKIRRLLQSGLVGNGISL